MKVTFYATKIEDAKLIPQKVKNLPSIFVSYSDTDILISFDIVKKNARILPTYKQELTFHACYIYEAAVALLHMVSHMGPQTEEATPVGDLFLKQRKRAVDLGELMML